MSPVTALVGGNLHTGSEIVRGQALLLQDGLVRNIVPPHDIPAGARRLDADGLTIAPGFIDLQLNGGGGVLFGTDPSLASLARIAEAHARFGVTGWLPTVISTDPQHMHAARGAVLAALQENSGGVLGIHYEGPWLNPRRKGVHAEWQLRAPTAADLDLPIAEAGAVTLVTLAPEQVPVDIIAGLVRRGAKVAAGHTAAGEAALRAARSAGLDLYTHLYNAMTQVQAREPGVVGLALADPGAWCSIIVDGHHVHYANVALAWRCKPVGRLLLVSDAMPPVGSDQTSFELDGRQILVRDGRCATPDGVLAGSAIGLSTAVANCVRHVGVPLTEALRMASTYVADYLGIGDRFGRLAPGYRADLVLLDAALQVAGTFRSGQSIFGSRWA